MLVSVQCIQLFIKTKIKSGTNLHMEFFGFLSNNMLKGTSDKFFTFLPLVRFLPAQKLFKKNMQ